MTCYFFYTKFFAPKLVTCLNYLKVSYRRHNATLTSKGVVKMIFRLEGTLATGTSKGHLHTPISVVEANFMPTQVQESSHILLNAHKLHQKGLGSCAVFELQFQPHSKPLECVTLLFKEGQEAF